MQPDTTPLSPHRPGAFQNPALGGGRAALPAGTIRGTFRPPSVPEGAKSCVSSGPQAPADRPPRSAFPKRRGSNREHLQEGSQGGSGPQGIPGFPSHPDLWSFGNKEAISGPLKSREKPMLLTMPRTYREASTAQNRGPLLRPWSHAVGPTWAFLRPLRAARASHPSLGPQHLTKQSAG